MPALGILVLGGKVGCRCRKVLSCFLYFVLISCGYDRVQKCTWSQKGCDEV